MTEFAFPVSYDEGEGLSSVVAMRPNSTRPVHMADSNHPHWEAILRGLREGDESVWELFDIIGGAMTRFQQITDRVSWNGSEVLWDGDPIHTALSDHLSRVIASGKSSDYTALAKFWEKLESNPEPHSREQAYDWLAAHKFQITSEGDIVGYKGVRRGATNEYLSSWASEHPSLPSAYVDGKALPPKQHVPQPFGSVVSMPRSEVVHDPSQACERGLHVATRSYAGGYGTVLEVHVNPRDVVSVPTAGQGAKVRVCRYKVVGLANDQADTESPVLQTTETDKVWAGDVGYKV